MATRTFRGTINSNSSLAANWLELAVPTSADAVVFDASSPNCTIDSGLNLLTLDCTGYTNTIAMNSAISVYGTSVIFGSSMGITTTNSALLFTLRVAATITPNGITLPITLTNSTNFTTTITSDWTVAHAKFYGTVISNSSTLRYIKVQGNINNTGLGGSFNSVAATPVCIQMIGTGTYTSAGYQCGAPFEINSPSGTITFGTANANIFGGLSLGNFSFNFKYTMGTVFKTGATFYFRATGNNFKIDASALTFENIAIEGLSEMLANLNVTNFYTTLQSSTNNSITGAFTLTCDNLLINQYGSVGYKPFSVGNATTIIINKHLSSPYSSATANTNTRLGIGSTGNVLTVSGGVPVWAAPAGGGKVLQVVSATNATSTSISSATFTDTSLSVSITPSATSSKVMVFSTCNLRPSC